jgi:NAD(P)H-dependent FMN reductase
MMQLLAICGSLRRASSNAAALEAAAHLAPEGVRIVRCQGLAKLPYFNPDEDREEHTLPSVLEWRRQIGASHGLLFCSPEYARGIAGVLKNALDWLVPCAEFPDKPVAVINASQRATHADAALRLTLTTMSARLIDSACITLPLLGRNLDAAGILADAALADALRTALDRFVAAIGTDPAGTV